MRRKGIIWVTLVFTLALALSSGIALAQGQGNGNGRNAEDDDDDDRSPISVGYAIVTPAASSTSGLVVFETFGRNRGEETTQAGVVPPNLTTDAVVFVNSDGRLSRNLGVSITNPNPTDATNIVLTLRDDNGRQIGQKTVSVKSHFQQSQFVTELFRDQPNVPRDLSGTLRIQSTLPLSVIGLRFRGENFSTIPITSLAPVVPVPVPVYSTGIGGPGAVLLPQFAVNGGWSTEIILMNPGSSPLTVRVDLFKQDGTPMVVRMNRQSSSSFANITVPANGIFVLAPRNSANESKF